MYIKATTEAEVNPTIVNAPEEETEYVYLGEILTNLPDTGGGWSPIYSTDVYATVATPITVDPEHQVDLTESQYIYDHVNHYAGQQRPA